MKNNSLLFIDDDKSLLEMMGKYFQEQDYNVFLAKDGVEGMEVFRKEKPDMVLVDLRMPKKDGFSVLAEVKEESPETPIVVISGEGEMADVIQALRMGAWNYHTKPVESYVIVRHTVEQALQKAHLIKQNKAYQKGLEHKLSTIIENFEGYIYTCNKDGIITYMNPSLTAYVGEEFLGTSGPELLSLSNVDDVWFSNNVEVDGKAYREEIENPADGRWFLAIHSVILDHAGEVAERQVMLYDITDRKKKLQELQENEEYLRQENLRLRASLKDRFRFGDIIGKSQAMQEVYETIINAGGSDASVVIYGESGTGKELVAQAIHQNSKRASNKLIYVNCGAIPENLIESEFFGYKKGAFTGANTDKYGFLDLATGGSLFLDEVGEIPINMQVKLLRALEGGGYTPIGGHEVKKPDFRIIAATNRDLKEMVRQGRIRQDFLYRIHIIPVELPPLRDRKEDIPLLVEHFLHSFDQDQIPPITPRITKAMREYDWPGNVRELQNTINRFVTLKKLDFMGVDFSEKSEIDFQAGAEVEYQGQALTDMLAEVEKKILLQAFEKFKWHQAKTAEALKLDPKTLYRKMKLHSIKKK